VTKEAPHIKGFPISPADIILPASHLDLEKKESFNNHHRLWTRVTMARLVLSVTCRDLSAYQVTLPSDVHAFYHAHYDPAPVPHLRDLMQRVDDAYCGHELLRHGSAARPYFSSISTALLELCKKEYEKLKYYE
jgi:hypothetical protein